MIRCKTEFTDEVIDALAQYHVDNSKRTKKRKNTILFCGIFLLIISCINAYGIWMKNFGTEPVISIISRASLYIIFSLIFVFAGLKSTKHNLKRELKKYFKAVKTRFLDYVITEEGIELSTDGAKSMYHWYAIDNVESDDKYYYFSCEGKHSIIAKDGVLKRDRAELERLFQKAGRGLGNSEESEA